MKIPVMKTVTLLSMLLCLPLTAMAEEPTMAQDEAAAEETAPKRDLTQVATAIQETFGKYQHALVDLEGETVVELVTENTIEYFDEIQELALYGTFNEVENRSLTDRMQIVTLRHRVPVSTLQKKSPSELLAYCVETGLFGKGAAALEIGEIRLQDGNAAVASTLMNGQPLPVQPRFVEEEGVWKLDMVSIISAADDALRAMAEQKAITQDDLILSMVSRSSGMDVGSEIWQPLLTRDGEGAAEADAGEGQG